MSFQHSQDAYAEQSLPQVEDESEDDEAELEDKAGSDALSREEPQFGRESFRASSGSFDGLDTDGGNLDMQLLQKRCEELESRVAELTTELEQSKKNMYFGSESGSISRSDLSKTSAREGDSSCEFPLVLALAATAGAMTSSSEADQANLLERELQSAKLAQGMKSCTHSCCVCAL